MFRSAFQSAFQPAFRPAFNEESGGGAGFSPAARDYFARLGALRVTAYDAANARLIDRLVGNGGNFWPDSGAFCAMAGYLYPGNGANLIPLKDGHDAGTLNAFVTGDWNAVTGLKGDGSTKYVDSNRNNNADGEDDALRSLYINSIGGGVAAYFGSGDSAGSDAIVIRSGFGDFITRSRRGGDQLAGDATDTGFMAISRSVGTEYLNRFGGVEATPLSNSNAPIAVNVGIFARITDLGTPDLYSSPRAAFYGLGPNLNGAGELAELDAALTEWQAALAAA